MHNETREAEQVLDAGIDDTQSLIPCSTSPPDWHRADILCAIKKAGSSLTALSRNAGLSPSTLSNVLYRPWPKGERIIAEFLNTKPEIIWPSRYRK